MAYPLNHAQNVLQRLLALNPTLGGRPAHHWLYLLGEKTLVRHDTDTELPFRQESNFFYLTGCDVPGSACTISYKHEGGPSIELSKIETKLYLPAVDPDEVMWCGLPPSPSTLSSSLHFTSITQGWTPPALFPPSSHLPTYIHTLPNVRSPKGLVATINGPVLTSEYLLPALHAARRNKSADEIKLMREANRITSVAHETLMRAFGKGEVKDENEAEAIFVATCRKMGAKQQAYTPIMASGSSAGTLHYIANDKAFPEKPALLLVDAGGSFRNYAGDVTRCIPIGNGGRFTKESRAIYEIVLLMQEAAFELIKPGASYETVQLAMHDVATRGLLQLGIFIAPAGSKASEEDLVKEIISSGLSAAFYPHGVGHLLGLDTHDVGGLPDGKSKNPLALYLRLRVPLEEGFVITVEPGIYFNEHLFAPHLNSIYVDHGKLAEYAYVGGVRIEDNVLVTANGFVNFATAPKTVAEVEAITATGH